MRKDIKRDTRTASTGQRNFKFQPETSNLNSNANIFVDSIIGGTTKESIDEPNQVAEMYKTSVLSEFDAFRLPSILECSGKGNNSPFRGFLDTSLVTQ
jgi:hypothetical protein